MACASWVGVAWVSVVSLRICYKDEWDLGQDASLPEPSILATDLEVVPTLVGCRGEGLACSQLPQMGHDGVTGNIPA